MRTFIALELPAHIQQQVAQLQKQLQSYLRDLAMPECMNWTPVAKIHLTLRFLGDTSQDQQKVITAGLPQAGLTQSAFPLTLAKLGCFPNFREPNVVWLDVQGDLPALLHLQAQTEQLAQAAGFAVEKRSFSPHITIGRARRDANRTDLRRTGEALKTFLGESATQQRGMPRFDTFVIDQLVYMQSELRPEGARYTALGHYPLQ